MIISATAGRVAPAEACLDDRSCTDADGHPSHAWTDGRRSWSCPGRAGADHDRFRPSATVIALRERRSA